ncbi:MAG TPA: aminotransferase class IV [Kofleriaceae bacterium]
MPDPIVWIDGHEVAAESASISIFDRGLLYGDGCFEVLRTWDGKLVEREAHLLRLAETAAYLQLRWRGVDAVRTAVQSALRSARTSRGDGARSDAPDHRVRIVLTRGPGALSVPMREAGPGREIVIVEEIAPESDAARGAVQAMRLATVDFDLPRRPGRGHKTLAYLDHVIAKELAREAGADDAIRCSADGHVAEGGTFNLFVVDGEYVRTPHVDQGVLPGIVRARVLRICERLGLPTNVGPIPRLVLAGATEVFATSSIRGVVPVVSIDARALSSGEVTQKVARTFVEEMLAGG